VRLLFDIVHPAHVHLFRNLIAQTQAEGGEVLVLTRDKDVTVSLCEHYRIPQRVLSRARSRSLPRDAMEFLVRAFRLWSEARAFCPDALLASSMFVGLVGKLVGRPSFVFNEDNREAVPLFARVAYPLATYIVTPVCLAHENYGERHLTYPGYQELAYLHPDHFVPDRAVPRSVGLDPESPYFILRLVSLTAHHDRAARGMTVEGTRELLELLVARGRVLITSEEELHPEFQPYRFPLSPDKLLDVLAFASLYIGDSQTMAAEAAVLGVPSLRCSSFVGRISYLEELEKEHGLTVGFRPEQFGKLVDRVREWLPRLDQLKALWRENRRKMLAQTVNVAEWQWATLKERSGPGSAARTTTAIGPETEVARRVS